MKPFVAGRAAIAAAFERRDFPYLDSNAARLDRQQGLPGRDDFMKDEFAPFLKCDTAARDLALLASAMAKHIARPSDAQRKTVTLEQADYDRSSTECERHLALKPIDAWAAYQSE